MKQCVKCEKQTNSCVSSDIGWLCYQCFDKYKPAAGPKRNVSHEEDDIQAEFFRLVPLFFPTLPEKLLFAVPNGGKRDKLEAVRLKRQGVKSGISDTILLVPKQGFASLCMEFKTSSGDQSTEQKEFQRQAVMANNKYVIVRSAMQAIEEMKEYLK